LVFKITARLTRLIILEKFTRAGMIDLKWVLCIWVFDHRILKLGCQSIKFRFCILKLRFQIWNHIIQCKILLRKHTLTHHRSVFKVHFNTILNKFSTLSKPHWADCLLNLTLMHRASHYKSCLVVTSQRLLEEPGQLRISVRDVRGILSNAWDDHA